MDHPFPELEIKLCYTILSKLKVSHLIGMDKDDIVQEIILSLIEDEPAWSKLRAKSTSSTLIYTALRNRIINLLDKNMTASDIARHSYKEASEEICNQLRNQEGNVWEVYNSLSLPERSFIKDFYNPATTIKRTELKHKHRITETQAARASRKVIRAARCDLTYRTLISLDQDEVDLDV
jgi:DNA-directed RNA polymerase specialized sigma24 family protein